MVVGLVGWWLGIAIEEVGSRRDDLIEHGQKISHTLPPRGDGFGTPMLIAVKRIYVADVDLGGPDQQIEFSLRGGLAIYELPAYHPLARLGLWEPGVNPGRQEDHVIRCRIWPRSARVVVTDIEGPGDVQCVPLSPLASEVSSPCRKPAA